MCCRPAEPYRHRLAATAVIALVAFVGCGAIDASDPSESNRHDAETPSETTSTAGGKADVYGVDGRREYFETDADALREVADATAVLVGIDDLERREDREAGWRVDETALEHVHGVCERERFSRQPAPGDCTGFLVGADRLVTAGHCIDATTCEETRVVFGFRYEQNTDESVTELPADDVYRCDEIAYRADDDDGTDVAVLALDRPVADRSPLEIRRTGKIDDGAPLAMIGHPAGLPLKVDRGGWVVDNGNAREITYNLDTYRGHSGSPVVDPETGRVEAIHYRGSPDFRPDLERSCLVSYQCTEVVPETRCRGNGGTRATALAPFVLPDRPDDGAYRFTDADDTLERPGGTIVADIYVPAIGSIEALRVITRLAADETSRIGLRLERGSPTGGESVRLLRDQMLAGTWKRAFPVDKFTGRETDGWWRIVVESDDVSQLDVETLALEIRTQ